ncbi:uncharacterized protein EDB93DRAFT_1253104 [Suillus bovinus]|uniref:uncharacterized protein n=1 Tax=Suillus bovinus TaxID=48563 RepID=UPI001B869A51|nr:uncharacterized protein EDB93DRAFT_1253104 [Suillus bovinus]KAG2139176.1 hypothetical protein EDB93DRAFT_1253104 [Suillus bovinus]
MALLHPLVRHTLSLNNSMTLVSNDPSWWPIINSNRVSSYFTVVASSAGVIYDLVLTLGQEVELVWTQRWSLMSILYLSVRYLGVVYATIQILGTLLTDSVPTISVTDVVSSLHLCSLLLYYQPYSDVGFNILTIAAVSHVIYNAIIWMTLAVNVMLCIITLTRLYAMYQRSRKMLIFLVASLLTVNISNGVLLTIGMMRASAEELILFGTYQCTISYEGDVQILKSTPWILTTAWEVLALCLAGWIAVRHFRDLYRHSAGGIIGDFVTVLMKTHVVYFSSFVVVSFFWLGEVSPTFTTDPFSLKTEIYRGFLQIILVVQLFVVGPRLILSVRRYRAELMTSSDAGTGVVSIAFQERRHASTSSL